MEGNTWGEVFCELCRKLRPYILVILMQFGFAGMAIIGKFALNEGMSPFTLSVYRHVFATALISPFALLLERNAISRVTRSTFLKITVLALLEPVLDQNMYYIGMKYTTATFTAAMCNVIPAITFVMAWIMRLENVRLREVRSIAKVLGTLVSVTGAMVMTLYKGPVINMPMSKGEKYYSVEAISPAKNMVKGLIFLTLSCFCWSAFVILQAVTLIEFPSELTCASLVCIMGALEGTLVALVIERRNPAAWSLHWDVKLFAALYAAIVCSGASYCIGGYVMKDKGPVFLTAFSPLSMIMVAAAGLFWLGEDMFLGRVVGSIIMAVGLYMVVWGKSKDQTQTIKEEEVESRIHAVNVSERV